MKEVQMKFIKNFPYGGKARLRETVHSVREEHVRLLEAMGVAKRHVEKTRTYKRRDMQAERAPVKVEVIATENDTQADADIWAGNQPDQTEQSDES